MKTVGIVGAGTMGCGIAQVAALSHLQVILYDVSTAALTVAMKRIKEDFRLATGKGRLGATEATEALSCIHPRKALSDLRDADFVVEATAEELEVKKEVFRKLDAIVGPKAILATNTSSLSVTAIAASTRTPESVVGMHFFNPPTAMTLVEVVRGAQTSDDTVRRTCHLAVAMKKTPIVCKDAPGFIVNRVARPFYGEALRLLDEKVADVETIDRIVRREGGFKMGPFELMDLIGIDINYAVTMSVYQQFFQEPRFRPHPIQRQMVESERLGRKTKHGFYRY